MRVGLSMYNRIVSLGRCHWHQQANGLSTATEASVAAGAGCSAQQATGTLYAACVLERLPVVLPKPKQWEVDYETWLQDQLLKQGLLKEYPNLTEKSEGTSKQQSVDGGQKLKEFTPVPSTTASEANTRTMRRRLEERLYLMIKGKENGEWGFPQALHEGDESIRETAERAMLNAVGRRYPIFFIGNAPMAHLSLDPSGGTVFHMLAQAVDDPWETKLQPKSEADDFAWVTKEEMLSDYATDPRLRELIRKML